jgi:two-component system, cell cycle sensor histidine kinase and response regulator CckA
MGEPVDPADTEFCDLGRLAHAVALASDAVWELHLPSGRFAASARRNELLGLSPDTEGPDVAAWQAMIHPEDAGRFAAAVTDLLAGGAAPVECEYRIRTARGVLHVLDRARVIERDASGAPVWIVGTLRDVTSLRAAEDALRHAQRIESLGRLAGGIAHDVNNLLTSIAGNAALLRRRVDASGRGSVRDIELAVETAGQLTRNLLAFSRKEGVAPRPVALASHVDGIAGLLRRLVGDDVDVDVELRSAGTIEIDPGQADQVVVNLVVNARDAMPAGGRVRIAVADVDVASPPPGWPRVRPGPYVVLTVADSGTGMTDEVREHLFEPFFTTKPRGVGTGLGLAMVHGIVDHHHGFIEVESEVGVGTTLRVAFPRASIAAAPPPRHPLWVRGDERIVIVEDDPLLREVLGRSLTDLGYTVDSFATGVDCLAALDRVARAQLVVTDLMMPGIDGRELVRQLRAALPGLRSLVMSGHVDRDADDGTFLAKPFHPAELARRVRDALQAA